MRKKIFSVFFALVLLLSFTLVTAVPAGAETVDREILNQTRLASFGESVVAEWDTGIVYSGDYSVHGAVLDGEGDFFNIVHMDIGDGTPITLGEINTIQFMEYLVSAGGTSDLSAAVILFLNDPLTDPPVEGVASWWDGYDDGITFHNNGESAPVGEWSVRDLSDSAQNWEGYADSVGTETVEPLSYWMAHEDFADWEVVFISIAAGAGDWAGYEGYIDNVMVEWSGGVDTYLTEPRIVNTDQETGYNYIQDAINAALEDETINVAAGTYAESVIVDKSLTLLGAKSNVDPRAGAWTSDITTINAGEGNNGILITASGVTVNGFKIVESGVHAYAPWGPSAIQAYNETAELEDLNIIYNWMDSNYGSGIIVRSAIEPVVEYNYVSNSGTDSAAGVAGLELTLGSFSYNEVFNCLSYGMYFGGGTEPDEPSGITGTLISYNNLHHNEKYGLQLYGYYGLVLTGLRQGVRLENNNFHDNGRNGIKLTDFTDTIVKDNQFSNNGGDGTSDKYKYGALVSAFYTVAGTEFTGNTFSGNELGGIYFLESVGGADFSNITVNFNDFLEGGTKSGIMNTTPAEIDAEDNWWGNASGPTHADNTFNVGNQGDAVSDLVDFVPWLNAPYDTALSFAPVALDGDADYSSIQAAINAATSSNITCAAGTYDEVVIVDESVELFGANAGVCAGVNPDIRGDESIVSAFSILANDVTIDGFKVIGGTITTPPVSQPPTGIFGNGGTSGHVITNNILMGPDVEAPGSGHGLEFGAGGITDITITCNEVDGWALGVFLNPSTDVLFQYNVVSNNRKGFDGTNATNLTVINNDFTDNYGHGFGLDNWLGPCTNIAVHFNNFCGNAMGVIYTCGNPCGPGEGIDATNNYWCSASGPSHSPGEGDPVSENVLYDPWLLGELVPGDPLPTIFEKTLALKIGWTLVSVDNWIDPASAVGADVTLAYSYIPGGGYTEVTPAALVPVDALYLKTDIGGGVGFDYSGGVPVASTKDLVVGWNLISSATYWNAQDILSPLRYIDVGDEQGVGLATLVSQGYFNQHTPSFYLSAVMPLDWGRLGYTTLNPFDGYWVYMNGPKSFGVIPGAQPPPN